MGIIKQLLPADTRPVELISGFSLFVMALLIVTTGTKFFPPHLHDFHQWQFWGIVSGLFGFLQVFAVVMEDMEAMRSVISWFTGIYWIWSGLIQISGSNGHFDDVVIMVLGASCMYAFIINLLFTKKHGIHSRN